MARITIQPNDRQLAKYYDTIKELRQQQSKPTEGNTRRAFGTLLTGLAKRRHLTLVEERQMRSKTTGGSIRTDGSLVDTFNRPYAHWEAKDTSDNLYAEIENKKAAGYPLDNIIFEDTVTAVLYQDGYEARSTHIREKNNFAQLLTQYLNYKAEHFDNFNEAVQSYGEQIREIATQLKTKIDAAHADNPEFQSQFDEFMELCRTSLNPNISIEAVDEMLIQHLMTERIIRRVFNRDHFTQTNVIAAKIEEVIRALTSHYFNRSDFYGALNRFHKAIEDAAEYLDFSDKQTFINTVYEKFFQGYSVKVADTHGIVYTPNEIVDFMCAAVEEVLSTEFGKKLGDEGVTVIDPATGTGNFVVNLLRRTHKRNLRNFEDFYRERLFANEVMLMPYYIASLNIEHAYYELTGKTQPFEGLCFVDTLDLARERQLTFFNEKNTERVERQKAAHINVIIGNPPYNVGQMNESDNNKNRTYDVIDNRIRNTYVKDSQATLRAKIGDAYVKFFRWATDRLENRDGIVCYVSNNSFVDAISFDGMRKHLAQDFDLVFHIDLGGNLRKSPPGQSFGNVFDIRVGVGITVAIRRQCSTRRGLFYSFIPDTWKKHAKLAFLAESGFANIDWTRISVTNQQTWLSSPSSREFESYLPTATKQAKSAAITKTETVFKDHGLGIATNRDAYVYSFARQVLHDRIVDFLDEYNSQVYRYKLQIPKPSPDEFVTYDKIKWTRSLKRQLKNGNRISFERAHFRIGLYRPFTKKHLYFDRQLNEEVYRQPFYFPDEKTEKENCVIMCSGLGSRASTLTVLISDSVTDLNAFSVDPNQCFPYYTYDEDGSNRRENITDWALDHFRDHYNDPAIDKWDIFNYVYGLLHHPGYRDRYALDLKRNLPRIPFAPTPSPGPFPEASGKGGIVSSAKSLSEASGRDLGWGWQKGGFWAFANAGQTLADLHLNYESVDRYQLDWHAERTPPSHRVEKMLPKGKTDTEQGNYKVYRTLKYNDSLTLHDIPERAFAYRLGNRSALDWIVDQYRVKTDKRSGITHDPNGYSDDPQYILKLIERVITVSLRTVEIVENLAQHPFRDDSAS